jgi:hypothetical protein
VRSAAMRDAYVGSYQSPRDLRELCLRHTC